MKGEVLLNKRMKIKVFWDRLSSKKWLVVAGLIFGLIVSATMILGYILAEKAKQERLAIQEEAAKVVESAPKRQIKRVFLEREGKEGTEYIEILWGGTINIYDKNRKLVKSTTQGFGRIFSLFDDVNQELDRLLNSSGGRCVITVETNLGNYTKDCSSNSGNGGTDVLDEIDKIIENAFAPTPTMAPTNTPAPTNPAATVTPTSAVSIQPLISVTPDPSQPTPLPSYMLVPPFKCEDYHSNKPFIISNIICGVD